MTDTRLHDEALLLSPYLDHVLEPGEAARLEAHLAGCDACRRQLEGLRHTVTMLRSLPAERMPRPVTIPVRRVGGWQWQRALVPTVGLAAAVMLAWGSYALGQSNRGPEGGGASSLALRIRQATAPTTQAQDYTRGAGAAFEPRGTVTVQTDRSAYSQQDTMIITARTTVTGAAVMIQFDRGGNRVRVPGAVTAPGETRATLKLATLNPPVTAGTYRVIATVALDADTVLVDEKTVVVQ
jgi:anti-sigma factor RsiW